MPKRTTNLFDVIFDDAFLKTDERVNALNKDSLCKMLSSARTVYAFIATQGASHSPITPTVCTFGIYPAIRAINAEYRFPSRNSITDKNAKNVLLDLLEDSHHGNNINSFKFAVIQQFLEFKPESIESHFICDASYSAMSSLLIEMVVSKLKAHIANEKNETIAMMKRP